MANRRSTYVFYKEQDYNNLKDAVYYSDYRNLYNDVDKVYWYGYWCSDQYRIDIMDHITQDELDWLSSSIREHNGHFVPNP